jgi:hypothetical protein
MSTKIINVDFSQADEYSAYLLGFIWADGHISKDTNSIRIEITTDDFNDLKHIFDQTMIYNIYQRQRENWKPITSIIVNNREQNALLRALDFDKKSYKAPSKVLSILPDEIKPFFFRGLSDGDGCFYINKKNYVYHYAISSSIEQDWQHFDHISKSIGFTYSISRVISKNGNKTSRLRITNKYDIRLFGNYIYQTNPSLGLSRKYNKFLEI